MKQGIHPDNYRVVVFKDMSDGTQFFSRSTAATKDTIEIDGVKYPLIKLEISNTSHPFYTGKSKLVDTVLAWSRISLTAATRFGVMLRTSSSRLTVPASIWSAKA